MATPPLAAPCCQRSSLSLSVSFGAEGVFQGYRVLHFWGPGGWFYGSLPPCNAQ